jgi:hypothetical protein
MTHCGYLNFMKKITVDVYILDMGYVSFAYLHISLYNQDIFNYLHFSCSSFCLFLYIVRQEATSVPSLHLVT